MVYTKNILEISQVKKKDGNHLCRVHLQSNLVV